jgi:hypothetical protein
MTEPANNLTLLEASVSVDGAISDVDRLIAAVNRMGEAFMRSGTTAKKGADDTDEAAKKAQPPQAAAPPLPSAIWPARLPRSRRAVGPPPNTTSKSMQSSRPQTR